MYHHPKLVDLPDGATAADSPRRFEANAAQTYLLLGIGLLTLAGGAVAFWYWQQGEMPGRRGVFPFLMLPIGAVVTALQLRNLFAPLKVVVTPEGFAVGNEVCRWDEV